MANGEALDLMPGYVPILVRVGWETDAPPQTFDFLLLVDGEPYDYASVPIPPVGPPYYRDVPFELSFAEPGTYEVSAGDQSFIANVLPAIPTPTTAPAVRSAATPFIVQTPTPTPSPVPPPTPTPTPTDDPEPIRLTVFPPDVDGLRVFFNGVVTTDTGVITRIHWDWGDGSNHDKWFPASHTYATPGSYQITVTAFDEAGGSSTTTVSTPLLAVAVPPPTPTATPYATSVRPAQSPAVALFCDTITLEVVAWDLPSAVGEAEYLGSIDISYLIPTTGSLDVLRLTVSTDITLDGGARLVVSSTLDPIIDGQTHAVQLPYSVPPASLYEINRGITDPINLMPPPVISGFFDVDGVTVQVSDSGACQ